MYIGLKDVVGDDKNSSFRWIGDNSTMSFTNWNPYEPSHPGEVCTEMKMNSGKWADLNCYGEQGAVCEIAPVSHVNVFIIKKNQCSENIHTIASWNIGHT